MLNKYFGYFLSMFLMVCFIAISVPVHSVNIKVTGLELKKEDKTITISWKANVPTAEFKIFRGYSPIRSLRMLSNALLIADLEPTGDKVGNNLYYYSAPFTDTITFEDNIFYLVVPEKSEYTAADFNENENFNLRSASMMAQQPVVEAKPVEILIDDTPEGLRIRVSAIQFAFGSSVLSSESYPVLNRVYDTIKKILDNPEANGISATSKIEIGGHTDDVGSAKKNLDLSKKRAASVVTYLVSKGLNSKLLSSVGYGGSKPVKAITADMTKEQKDENRALNRRVEFFIRK